MTCELIENCVFYSNTQRSKPVTAKIYKSIFCDLDFAKCARSLIANQLGREYVPPDLAPHQKDRIQEIIRAVAA